jgi:hypothetical protein
MSAPAAVSERPSAVRLGRIALACALLAFALHGANLIYRARAHGCDSLLLLCATEVGPWATGDFPTYLAVADEIRDAGFLGASYYQRTPAYPLLLFAARELTGEVSPVRWFGPLCIALAAAAAAWLAARAGGRAGVAWLCGLAVALWPNGFRFSTALRPDGPHAFLALAALAATLAFARSARRRDLAAASALWILVQGLRPSFFGVAAALWPLFARALGDPARRAGAVALLASTLAVPAFVVGHNGWTTGAWVPTQVGGTNLACYAVPRLQQELGEGDFLSLRRACEARFDAMPRSERDAAQRAHALAYFRAHPKRALASFARELVSQLGEAASPSRHADLYPAWLALGPRAIWAYWLLALVGIAKLARLDAALALTLALLFALVMLPASSSHLVGPRLRLPVDYLFALPVSLALGELASALAQRLRRRNASQAQP